MTHGSLFSGIGGFDLASEWMGWENVFQVEWDLYCQKVLAKNFPNVKRYGDIKEFDGTKYRGFIDIISGGFPCQPFSNAGKKKGKEDDRYLWPEMLRIISEIKPSYIVGENVTGLINMENGRILDGILSDLENKGYKTEQFIIPACSVGAWHRRDRLWIIAYRKSKPGSTNTDREDWQQKQREFRRVGCKTNVSNSISRGQQGQGQFIKSISSEEIKNRKAVESRAGSFSDQWRIEPAVGRVANGVPDRMDRLKGLGNAVVPQVVYQIFKAIEQYNTLT